jgi:hypothetical protein
MGDLNAKVGNENIEIEKVIGKQAEGERNENGERIIELRLNFELTICGTLFLHKSAIKYHRYLQIIENKIKFKTLL